MLDYVIIGGGIVGCAIFRSLCSRGVSNGLLIEKNESVISEASAGNSGIFHTGFDAPPNSLELFCMKRGYKELIEFQNEHHEKFGIKLDVFQKCGALVVAWNEEELKKLDSIVQKAHQLNGFTQEQVHRISRQKLFEMEPNLFTCCPGGEKVGPLGAVHIPDEGIVDPAMLPLLFLHQGISAGGSFITNCKVINVEKCQDNSNGVFWKISARLKEISHDGGDDDVFFLTRCIINSAGNYGDLIEKYNPCPNSSSHFKIIPRKGQFAVYEKDASKLFKSIILPVPTERTKGVLISRTVYGNVIVGPTAEDQLDRRFAAIDNEVIEELTQKARNIIPLLKNHLIEGSYAGLRPSAADSNVYHIGVSRIDQQTKTTTITDRLLIKENNPIYWITVGAIRSTGLTAALGIGEYVYRLYNLRHVGQELEGKTTQEIMEGDTNEVARKVFCIPHPISIIKTISSKPLKIVKANGHCHIIRHPIFYYGNDACHMSKL